MTHQQTASDAERPLGTLTSSDLSVEGDASQHFKTHYTYAPGGYLKAQRFEGVNWKSIDRDWDTILGLVTASRDSDGTAQIDYSYDALRRVKKIDPGSTEEPTDIIYDPSGLGVEVKQSADGLGEIYSQYSYDSLYRLVTTKRRGADDGIIEQALIYDAAGRVTSRTEWDSPGVTSTFQYGAYLGPVCGDKDADGTHDVDADGTSRTYPDPLGRISQSNAGGVTSTTRYDGLKTHVTVAGISALDGSSTTSRVIHTNDAFGRLVSVNYPACDPAAPGCSSPPADYHFAQAQYAYDREDHLTHVLLTGLDADGTLVDQPRSFVYDALGRLRSATNPENGTQQYTKYDATGDLRERIDPAGRSFAYTFDAQGRLTETRRTGWQTPLEVNEYRSSDGRLETTKSYDDLGAMVSERKRYFTGLNGRLSSVEVKLGGWDAAPPALVTEYTYNNLGLVKDVKYPRASGDTRTRSSPSFITHNGYMTQVSDVGRLPQQLNYLSNILYSASGAPTEIQAPGSQTFAITYDIWSRPSRYRLTQARTGSTCPATGLTCSVQHPEFPCLSVEESQNCTQPSQPDTWWDSGTYAYDGAGNISTIGTSFYRYDPLGRLREKAVQTGFLALPSRRWQYDAFGNMKQEERFVNGSLARTDAFMVSAATNRLASLGQTPAPPGQGTVSFTFDQSGNMTSDGLRVFEWDDRGRLNRVQKQSGTASVQGHVLGSYGYDSSGYRVRMIENGLETLALLMGV